MTIIDISPLLTEDYPVWPGDQPLRRLRQLKLEDGHSVELSSLHSTVHLGAHADAPNHFAQGAASIGEVPLLPYIGPCLVVDVQGRRAITRADCEAAVKQKAERVLFKTARQEARFPENFCYFMPEAIAFMGEAGVLLVGIDTPSVDPFDSKDLPAHHALLRYDMRNLEGLDLTAAAPGVYELIALPLRLMAFDASPVRAILRS